MQSRIAAIDVGSNSMRVAVIETDGHAHLEVLQEARAVPRLIRDVRATGRLSPESIELVLDILREYIAIARTSGATEIAAVATSAVRDAANSEELVVRVRDELRLDLRVVSGEEEARLAFLGALHSLPVTDGVVVDVGGGSAEVVRFRGRTPEVLATLQLGAVRLTDEFLTRDPPAPAQLKALRGHLARELSRAGFAHLAAAEHFVGTGGTIRNLAKVARARSGYPLPRLHGYTLSRQALAELVSALATMPRAERAAISGLNEDRADTIVAGALVIEAMTSVLRARAVVVSGQGLREGVALSETGGPLISVPKLRQSAVDQTLDRFAPTTIEAARRRAALTRQLCATLALPDDEVARALPFAATLLDIGRGIDYYNRHRHTETLLLARGLDGFTHREQALIGALVRQANQERYDLLAYAPLLTEADRAPLARAATLLSLADELEQRLPPASPLLGITVVASRSDLEVTAPLPDNWDPLALRKRLARTLDRRLVITHRSDAI